MDEWTIICDTANLGLYDIEKMPTGAVESRQQLAVNWTTTVWSGKAKPPEGNKQVDTENLHMPWKVEKIQAWRIKGGKLSPWGNKDGITRVISYPDEANKKGWSEVRSGLEKSFRKKKNNDAETFSASEADNATGELSSTSDSWSGIMASLSNYGAPVNENLGFSSFHSPQDFNPSDDDLKDFKKQEGVQLILIPVPSGYVVVGESTKAGEGVFSLNKDGKRMAAIRARACNTRADKTVWNTIIGPNYEKNGPYLVIPNNYDDDKDLKLLKKNWRKDFGHQVGNQLNCLQWWRSSIKPPECELDWKGLKEKLIEGVQLFHDRAGPCVRYGLNQYDLETGTLDKTPQTIAEELLSNISNRPNLLESLGFDGDIVPRYNAFVASMGAEGADKWRQLLEEALEQWGDQEYANLLAALRVIRYEKVTAKDISNWMERDRQALLELLAYLRFSQKSMGLEKLLTHFEVLKTRTFGMHFGKGKNDKELVTAVVELQKWIKTDDKASFVIPEAFLNNFLDVSQWKDGDQAAFLHELSEIILPDDEKIESIVKDLSVIEQGVFGKDFGQGKSTAEFKHTVTKLVDLANRSANRVLEELDLASQDEDLLLDLFIKQWELLVLSQHGNDAKKAAKMWWATIGSKSLSRRRVDLVTAIRDSGRSLSERYGDGLSATFWQDLKAVNNVISQKTQDEIKCVKEVVKQAMVKYWNREKVDNNIPQFMLKSLNGNVPDSLPSNVDEALEKMVVRDSTPKELRRTVPHPLRVDIPFAGGTNADVASNRRALNEMAGVLVLAKRKSKEEWRCITMAELTAEYTEGTIPKDASINQNVISPFQINVSGGVEQGVIEYQERPITAELEEVKNRKGAVSGEEVDPVSLVTDIKFTFEELSPSAGSNEWGKVLPLLVYNKGSSYDFACIPVHNSGALPPQLAQKKTVSHLKDYDMSPKPKTGNLVNHVISRGPYKRRVPVGSIRHSGPARVTSIKGNKKVEWTKFHAIMAPKSVAPVVTELLSYRQNQQGPLVGQQEDLTIYVLWPNIEGAQNRSAFTELDLFLRPPSIECENWLRGYLVDSKRKDATEPKERLKFLKFLQNVENCYHGLVDKKAGFEVGSDLTLPFGNADDLIDDDAVVAVKVEIEELCTEDIATDLKYKPFDKYVYMKVKTAAVYSKANLGSLEDFKELQQVFGDIVATDIEGLEGSTSGRFSIERKHNEDNRIHLGIKNGALSLIVPPGRMCKVRLIPCMGELQKEIFDTIYVEAKDVEAKDIPIDLRKASYKAGGKDIIIYEIIPSARDFYIESVPVSEYEKGNTKPLPTPEELWNALSLDVSDERRLRVSLKEAAKKVKGDWRFVGAIEVAVQPWRWTGRIQSWDNKNDRPLLCSNAKLLSDQTSQNTKNNRIEIMKNELADFEGVADNDVFVYGGLDDNDGDELPDRFSLINRLGKDLDVELYRDEGSQERVARYYRVRLRIWSRYMGLPGFGGANVSKKQHGKTVDAATSYKRIVVPGRLQGSTGPPRVKMVIPMLDSAPMKGKEKAVAEDRPGFLVITADGLGSPFHFLEGDVAIAEYNKTYYAEIGTDPITSTEGLLEGVNEKKITKLRTPLRARAFGLTVEREGDNAAFPYAACAFDFPKKYLEALKPKDKLNKLLQDHDLFVKLSFRWRIWSEEDDKEIPGDKKEKHLTMDDRKEHLSGELTTPWQFRLLAPYRRVKVDGMSDLVDLEDMCFKGINTLAICDKAGNVQNIQPPIFKGKTGVGNLRMTFAFLSWRMAPDLLSSSVSKYPVGIHIMNPDGNDWKEVWRRPEEKAEEGQFLVIMTREAPSKSYFDKLAKNVGSPEKINNERLRDFAEALFPDQKSNKDKSEAEYEPAKMMIVRSSSPIKRYKP